MDSAFEDGFLHLDHQVMASALQHHRSSDKPRQKLILRRIFGVNYSMWLIHADSGSSGSEMAETVFLIV